MWRNYFDAVAYGLAIYAISIASWQLLIMTRIVEPRILLWIQLGIIGVCALGAAVRCGAFRETRAAFLCAVVWVVIFILFDLLFVAPGFGFIALLFPSSVYKYAVLTSAVFLTRGYFLLLRPTFIS